jgi:hypothetical protein
LGALAQVSGHRSASRSTDTPTAAPWRLGAGSSCSRSVRRTARAPVSLQATRWMSTSNWILSLARLHCRLTSLARWTGMRMLSSPSMGYPIATNSGMCSRSNKPRQARRGNDASPKHPACCERGEGLSPGPYPSSYSPKRLVRFQDRFRVVSYSKRYETSNLCTCALKRGAQTARSWAALQRRFHLTPTNCQ